jgi:hypothetical protein
LQDAKELPGALSGQRPRDGREPVAWFLAPQERLAVQPLELQAEPQALRVESV